MALTEVPQANYELREAHINALHANAQEGGGGVAQPDAGFGKRVQRAMDARGIKPTRLAALFPTDKSTVSKWRAGRVPDDPVRLQRLATILRVPLKWLTTGQGSVDFGEEGNGGQAEIEALGRDPDYPPEGSGLETQIPEDEVLELLLFNRQGFTRYLMTRFEQPVRLPMAARLGFLNYIERLARDSGNTVPPDYLDHLRGLIRSGGL